MRPALSLTAAFVSVALVILGEPPSRRQAAWAHSFAPALLEIRESANGVATVLWKTSPTQASAGALEPLLPESCTRTTEPVVAQAGEGIAQTWTIACSRNQDGTSDSTLVGRTVAIRGLDVSRTDALVRIALADGRTTQTVLRGDEPSLTIPARPSHLEVLRSYGRLGFEHILTGPDHLLFVLGLLLIVRGRRSLVETITAFTVGHSLTLSLAVLGIADVSSAATELAIALSVLALAVEVARGESDPPTLIRSRPWVVSFAFGLLHGLGFAGALREIGLPDGDIPLALLSFNLGIEAGQLAFVVLVEVAWVALRRTLAPRMGSRLERAAWIPSYVMGSLAAYWCFERAAALFS